MYIQTNIFFVKLIFVFFTTSVFGLNGKRVLAVLFRFYGYVTRKSRCFRLFHGPFGFRKFGLLRGGRSGGDDDAARRRFTDAVHRPRPDPIPLLRDTRIAGRRSLHGDHCRGRVRFRRPFTAVRRRRRRRLLLLLPRRPPVGLPLRRVRRRLFAGRLQQRRLVGRGRGPLERVVVERPAGAARAELDAAHAARQEPGLDAARRVLPLPQERVDGRPFFRFPRFQRGLAQFDLSARTHHNTIAVSATTSAAFLLLNLT